MSTQCLDPTFFISERDSTGGEKSTQSTLSSIPYHPAEQGIAQTREEIESTLKSHGVLIDSSLSFEYIVVGGGTAGLVVASRLAESLGPGQYVCVVEAGTYRQDPLVDVPGAFGMSNMNQDYDWSYKTVPQENLHDRRLASSAGRLLGGSSGINFLVRMRASGTEYDAWNAFGNGWDWQGLLPYFKAEERYEGYVLGTDQIFPGITKKEDEEARLKEPEFRGHSGPVYSTHNNIYTDLLQPTIETTLKFGIKTNRTPGYGVSTGMFNIDIAVNRQQGTRSYAANAYLRDPESIVPQSNVVVLKHVYATKILFDAHASGQGAKAVGLACLGGVDWKSPHPVDSLPAFELKVNKEIIVSTGTFNTPRLLELSGIGNPEILSKFNITPIVRLPTVGENLQEHPVVVSDFVVKDGVFTLDKLRVDPKYRAEQAKEYCEKRTGAYATTVSAYGFFKLKNFLTEKEVEELRTELDKEILRASNGFYKKQLVIQRRFLDNDDVGDVELIMVPKVFASDPKDNTSYISFIVLLPHPVARGSVHISSSEPLAPPSIDPQYLNNLHDTKILTKAMQFVRKLSETAPLKDIIVTPSTPGPELQTEAQFEEFVRNHLKYSGHPIGTAAMAPQPLGGVVDENLRIYGTQNVRVVDMSIAPLHLAAHLLDTAYAIGEKGADLIKAELNRFIQPVPSSVLPANRIQSAIGINRMSQAVGNTALAYARVWRHVDASDRVLGKLAERIALVLMGKHKPIYDKGLDCGDYVVVTNARNIKVSGRKDEQLVYRKHTMYPGGLKETPYKTMMEKKPNEIIYHAVSGMLPKNKLRDRRMARLKVFGGPNPGIYRNNFLKRWEDGTLTDEYVLKLDSRNKISAPSSSSR